MPASVASVHDTFAPFVCESLARGPAEMRIVSMDTTQRSPDLMVANRRHDNGACAIILKQD